MSKAKEPPIVAELGRPETLQESADRRAESSRVRRQSKTFPSLIVALLASFAVVAVIMLVVVRPDVAPREPIDYHAISAEADASVPLAAPDVPADWWSNSAIYEGTPADGVANWYVGFVTPSDKFIGFRQGVDANPTWLANQLAAVPSTGSTTIDGIEWSVYDRRGVKDVGIRAYALSAVGAQSTYVLYGTASVEEFTILATQLAATITADH